MVAIALVTHAFQRNLSELPPCCPSDFVLTQSGTEENTELRLGRSYGFRDCGEPCAANGSCRLFCYSHEGDEILCDLHCLNPALTTNHRISDCSRPDGYDFVRSGGNQVSAGEGSFILRETLRWEIACSTARRCLSDSSGHSGTQMLSKFVRFTSVL